MIYKAQLRFRDTGSPQLSQQRSFSTMFTQIKLTNAQIQTPDIPAKSRVSRSTGQTDKIVLIKRRFEILLQAWLLTINAGPGECSTEKYSTRALEEKRVLRDDSDGGTGKAMLVFSFFIKFSSSSRDCTHFHCISSAFVQDLDLKHSLIPRRRKSLMTPSVRLILAYGGSANTLTVTLFNGQFGLELLSLWRIEARPKSMNVAKTKQEIQNLKNTSIFVACLALVKTKGHLNHVQRVGIA